jgi:hypothetical protein
MSAAVLPFESRYYVSLVELARELRIEETTIRRWVWSERVVHRTREGSKAIEVDAMTLPPKYKAAYLALHPTLASGARPNDEVEPKVARYTQATGAMRSRADERLEAVLSFTRAVEQREDGETLAEIEEQWERNYRRSHSRETRFSLRSVKRWKKQFETGGLDGLLDGNDGSATRGSRIPAPAKQFFRDFYLRSHRPNLRLCYDAVCIEASVRGWGEMPSYETFRKYGKSLPKMLRLIRRDCADTPRTVMPWVERDPTSIPVYDTLQLDHHEVDVPVRCDTGCVVCTGKRPKGHYPIWTAWIDIHSRRIMTSDLAIETPTYRTVTTGLRRLVVEHGLMNRLYVDNGADIRKALGKRMRRMGLGWDGPEEPEFEARLTPFGIKVTYAIPYNAQAKMIERMFRTFRHRFSELFEAYRGQFGERSEKAAELFYKPQELPTISELAYLLQFAIDEYNDVIKHTGKGMNRRTPSEVFSAPGARIPLRKPHEEAFRLCFFEPIPDAGGTRIVGANGVRHDNRTYRLSSLDRQIEYYATRVEMRVDPDDPRVAILLDLKTGAYICDARVDDAPATYDTRDAVTQKMIARVFRDIRDIKLAAARATDPGSEERIKEHLRNRVAYYQQLFAKRAEAAAAGDAAAAIGGTTLVLAPGLSGVARERERAMMDTPALTADDLALLFSDGDPASEPTGSDRPALSLVPAQPANEDAFVAEQIRKRHERLCEIDFCENRVGSSELLCPTHESETGWRDDLTTS